MLGGYLLATVVMTFPLALVATRAIPMDPQIEGWYPGDGDPWHYLWAFWYFKRALLTFPPNPFWTDLVFYPLGFDMPFVTGVGAILLPAAVLAPLLGLTLTYNVLWVGSFVLAGYAMYRLADHLLGDGPIAFFCGLVFTFSSYRMVHGREHLPLLLASFLVPLFALALFRAAAVPSTKRYVQCALVWALSAGVSWYATIALSLYLVVFLLVQVASRWPGRAIGDHLRPLAVAGLVALVGASAFVLPMVVSPAAHDGILDRSPAESDLYTADLLAFFVPSPTNPLFGGLTRSIYERFTGNRYEQTVYLGYVLVGLALWGMRRAPREKRRLLGLTTAVFFVLALGPWLHVGGRSAFTAGDTAVRVPLPYLLLGHVPFVNGMRVPSRFAELLVFALTLLAGYGLSALTARAGRAGKLVLVTVLAVVAAAELASLPYPVVSTRTPPIYRDIAAAPGPFTVLELPLDWRIIRPHYDQAIHGKRLLVGHPVRSRDKYTEYPAGLPLVAYLKDPRRLLDGGPPADATRDAERLVEFFDVRYVVLHRRYLEADVFQALDRFVAEHFPHAGRWADDEVVAYAVKAPPSRARWPRDYMIDFGANREFVLLSGWSRDERIEDTTFQWSLGSASTMFLFLEDVEDRVLELRLQPLTYPGSPAQAVRVDVNDRPRGRLLLQPGWGRYRMSIPAAALRPGLNRLTFTYRYAAAALDVIPGTADTRKLGVAFDYVALRRAP